MMALKNTSGWRQIHLRSVSIIIRNRLTTHETSENETELSKYVWQFGNNAKEVQNTVVNS